MSEETTEVQDTTEQANEINPQELIERLNALEAEREQLKSTNDRLLMESKQNKEKYKSVKEQMESTKFRELEDKGNWEELYKSSEQKIKDLTEQSQKIKMNALKKELKFKVATVAPNARDIDDVMNVLPRELLKFDDETFSVEGVEDAIAYVKEKKPWYFDEKVTTGMVGNKPDSGKPKEVTFNELPKEEQDRLFLQALGE